MIITCRSPSRHSSRLHSTNPAPKDGSCPKALTVLSIRQDTGGWIQAGGVEQGEKRENIGESQVASTFFAKGCGIQF